jgi:hypothetical protein
MLLWRSSRCGGSSLEIMTTVSRTRCRSWMLSWTETSRRSLRAVGSPSLLPFTSTPSSPSSPRDLNTPFTSSLAPSPSLTAPRSPLPTPSSPSSLFPSPSTEPAFYVRPSVLHFTHPSPASLYPAQLSTIRLDRGTRLSLPAPLHSSPHGSLPFALHLPPSSSSRLLCFDPLSTNSHLLALLHFFRIALRHLFA